MPYKKQHIRTLLQKGEWVRCPEHQAHGACLFEWKHCDRISIENLEKKSNTRRLQDMGDALLSRQSSCYVVLQALCCTAAGWLGQICSAHLFWALRSATRQHCFGWIGASLQSYRQTDNFAPEIFRRWFSSSSDGQWGWLIWLKRFRWIRKDDIVMWQPRFIEFVEAL